ncbi:hypothetical protein MMC28_011616 [Mycoblastus sanguinarius]|nr:hypothetical protein [Mycoblastus sanguinarius]
MSDKIDFTGYRWHGIAKCPEDPRGSSWQQQKQAFFDSLNWDALCQYASRLPIFNGKACTIDSQITTGGRNMVRLIHVEGGSPCVARVRMSPTETNDEAEAESQLLQREVNCIKLVKERISVPVPAVLGYIANAKNDIGAPFMLMECLPGNVAMDLNFAFVPTQYKSSCYSEMARFQTEISSIVFPKIGAISRLEDGTYDIGPLPGLGGPFSTATEYIKAWAATAKFRSMSKSMTKEACGDMSDEIEASIAEFPIRLMKLVEN